MLKYRALTFIGIVVVLFNACTNIENINEPKNKNSISVSLCATPSDQSSCPQSTGPQIFTPGDEVRLIAEITPQKAKAELYYLWTLIGENQSSPLASPVFKLDHAGSYWVRLELKDTQNNLFQDSLRISVNSAPEFIADSFYPADSIASISPTNPEGLTFNFKATDFDNDSLSYFFEIGADTNDLHQIRLLQPPPYRYIWPLEPSTPYYWRAIVRDRRGAADTSAWFILTTTPQNLGAGYLQGTVLVPEELNASQIQVVLLIDQRLPIFLDVDERGVFLFYHLQTGVYKITSRGPGPDYQSDTLNLNISQNQIINLDTFLQISDTLAPQVDSTFFNVEASGFGIGNYRIYASDGGVEVLSATAILNGDTLGAPIRLSFQTSHGNPLRAFDWAIGQNQNPSLRAGINFIEVSIADLANNIATFSDTLYHSNISVVAIPDTTVNLYDNVHLYILPGDSSIIAEMMYWDTDADGIWNDSSALNSTLVHSFSTGNSQQVILGLRDIYGNIGLDTSLITLNHPPQKPVLVHPLNQHSITSESFFYWNSSLDPGSPAPYYTLWFKNNNSPWTSHPVGELANPEILEMEFINEGTLQWAVLARDEYGAVVSSDTFSHNVVNPVRAAMKLIPAGFFVDDVFDASSWTAGWNGDTAYISYDFWMDSTEVTKWDFYRVMGYDLSPEMPMNEYYNYPAIGVSWLNAIRYANALSKRHGLDTAYSYDLCSQCHPDGINDTLNTINCDFRANAYRLAYWDEWELAGRAGLQLNYANSTGLPPNCVYGWQDCDEAFGPVASFAPNPYGIYDLDANAYEYLWDIFYNEGNRLNQRIDYTGPARANGQRISVANAPIPYSQIGFIHWNIPIGSYYGFRLVHPQ
jgi:hypothetical protein